MAQTAKTPQEFIQHSFSPLVAVLCSPGVEQIVCRNNLTFSELLQPFCSLSSEGHIRDPSGGQCSVKGWRLLVRDVNWLPPPPPDARRLLSHAVASNTCDRTVPLTIGKYSIDIPYATPWLERWRESYLELLPAAEHEFTRHFVACLLVGSTADGDVASTFSALLHQLAAAQAPPTAPPAVPPPARSFNGNVLRAYVLLHDLSTGNKDKAERAFETLKQTYGAGNCFFLCINSRKEADAEAELVSSDLWRPYISTRSATRNEPSNKANSLPRTPVDVRAVTSMPANVISGVPEEHECFSGPTQGEVPHPLSPAEEPDTGFDTANSLQDTMSGSMESVSSLRPGAAAGETPACGAALTSRDLDTLKQFLNDFAFKALLPYFERQIAALHEAVANRKGVSRSLLSATKRWFGTSKPGTNTTVNTVVYTAESPELQLRRLGDLWFMCGQWARAYDAYHAAKREFNADGAWPCYAGALEMAALSAFLADEPTRKTYTYMEESIVTYLNTCRMVQLAVRATLLSAACLSSRGLHGDAAKQLIRMTSEESDLRSAVLLEQAALCFVAGPARRALPRKYAFHMVLAGNRYSKAGQKRHAYRCYKQAFQVYCACGWRLAADHVQYALGRLAGAGGLRRAEEAASWLAAPLAPHSAQPPPQQLALLREYTRAHQQWMETSVEHRSVLPVLAVPRLLSDATRVLCGGMPAPAAPGRVRAGTAPTAAPTDRWHKMEEMLLQRVRGAVPVLFRPTVALHTPDTDNTGHPTVPQGEPIYITVELENPLRVPLSLADVELLWRFEAAGGEAEGGAGNEASVAAGRGERERAPVTAERMAALALAPRAVQPVTLALTPLCAGDLQVLAVAYKLCNSIEGSEDAGQGTVIAGKQLFEIRGPRLKNNKDTPKPEYGVDRRLQIKVTPSAPCLQMTFSEVSGRVVSGELVAVDVELRNVGPVALHNLHVCVSHPDCMTLVAPAPPPPPPPFADLYRHKYRETPANVEERVVRAARWRECCARHVTRVSEHVTRATLLLRPTAAAHRLHLLAYYESASPPPPPPGVSPPAPPPYRLLRHTFSMDVVESVKIVAIPRRNIRLKGEDPVGTETLNLAVEVKNISTSTEDESIELEVLVASLLSRQWRLTESVAAGTAGVRLGSHEKVHLVLRGCRDTSELLEEEVIHTGIVIGPSHAESAASVAELPYREFVAELPSPWDEHFDARGQGLASGSAALIRSMLVVRWKARVTSGGGGGREAVGQHSVWLECFADRAAAVGSGAAAGAGVESAPLRLFGRDEPAPGAADVARALHHTIIFRLEHSAAVQHDFGRRKLCIVPVTVHLVNCHSAPVTAFINLSETSERDGGVGWTGAVCRAVALGAFQARRLRAGVAVPAPGVYQLADALRVTCSATSAAAPHAAAPHAAASLLVVRQAAC